MKLRKGVNPQEWEDLKNLYRGQEGAVIVDVAEKLSEALLAAEMNLNDALVQVLHDNPSDANINGLELIEVLSLLTQVWEDGEKLLEGDILSFVEYRLVCGNLAQKLFANQEFAAKLGQEGND